MKEKTQRTEKEVLEKLSELKQQAHDARMTGGNDTAFVACMFLCKWFLGYDAVSAIGD